MYVKAAAFNLTLGTNNKLATPGARCQAVLLLPGMGLSAYISAVLQKGTLDNTILK